MAPRVLFVLDEFPGPHAGTEAQFWLLFRGLDRGLYRPRVVTLRPSEYLHTHLAARDYECLAIATLGSPATYWRALRFALRSRREGFSIAHLYLNDVSVLLPAFFWLAGIFTIVSRRDLGFWYTPRLLRVLRFNRRFVARVVANCGAVRDVVCAAEGYGPDRVNVILNGLDLPQHPAVAGALRFQHGVPADAYILGMIANLRPLKRVEDAIRAVAALKARSRPVWLLVAGEDRVTGGRSQQAMLEELARSLGVEARVAFVGPIEQPWPFLAQVDVFLSCSDTEGLSNSVMEAMGAGRPVVATAVGGTPELIEDGVTGFLYEPRDVEGLTRHLERLADDAGLCERVGAAAERAARERFSVATLVERHAALYAELAGATEVSRRGAAGGPAR